VYNSYKEGDMSVLYKALKPHILSAEPVTFSAQLKERLGPRVPIASKNNRHVMAAVFRYRSAGGVVAGFVVAPRKYTTPLPAIVYNRGGTKNFGLVRKGNLLVDMAEIAKWGYVVIGSQYPGNSTGEGDDEWGGRDFESIADLYPIMQKLSIIDTNRIGMMGGSRGGMMTYLALKRLPWVKAAVTISGVTNLIRNSVQRPEMGEVFTEAFGGSDAAKRERSAAFWASELNPNVPLLMMHGTKDKRVNAIDTAELAVQLRRTHPRAETVYFGGGDHALEEFKDQWQRCARDWLGRYLQG
jgi:dipeptidyl aminopeptidase/acylaminoacyl peptidase